MSYYQAVWEKAGAMAVSAGKPTYEFRKACYEKMLKDYCACPAGSCGCDDRLKQNVADRAMTPEQAVRGIAGQPTAARKSPSFTSIVEDALAKAAVGQVQQGVAFSGAYSPLIPSNMAGPGPGRPKLPGDTRVSEWPAEYVNGLPDSAFLAVMSGGKKDPTGRTAPRDLRKFPVRDMDRQFDATQLRSAISCAPKAKGMDAGAIAGVLRKAREILKRMGERGGY